MAHTTFFATEEFATAWCRTSDSKARPVRIHVVGSGPPRSMYVVEEPGHYGTRVIPLTRYDFFLSPGWDGRLELSTVRGILDQITGARNRRFVWNVRWDHTELAATLESLGLNHQRNTTHVVRLDGGHEHVFARSNTTMRNQVRKAHRRGVIVRATVDSNDLQAYNEIYSQHAQYSGWTERYPAALLVELLAIPGSSRFIVAEFERRVIAGALFLRDGNLVVYYMHGVADRAYSHLFPARALMDEGIRWACESGAAFCNLGMSGGVVSLEVFKAAWGASTVQNWSFHWDNALWLQLSKAKRAVRRVIGVYC